MNTNTKSQRTGTLTAKCLLATALLFCANHAFSQSDTDDAEALRVAAVEALITAPPERALPLARKVVEGNYSDDLKERALFVLSQIQDPEAQEIILAAVRNSDGALREEAIRMIGIGGDPAALAGLRTFFNEGDEDVREAVLEAYLIAEDSEAVYQLALETTDPEVFEQVVETLGAMGAHEKLRQLRDHVTLSDSEVFEALIEAYTIAGDLESIRTLAMDSSDPEQQEKAIEGLGIIGGEAADAALLEIYRSATNEEVREAALDGLMISGNDEILLELYRSAGNAAEKRRILEYLVIMDSDAVWEVIDQALEEDQ
ncbi:MAG: HEAT repeat domain-containing protein [Xanthomonadales bacterium]|nr:HEAT repeat domain-containing protein [Xanthomonadales bacterium]